MVRFQTKSVTAFSHIHGAEAETKDIKFACLSRALSITFTINQLLFLFTVSSFHTLWNTCSITIYHAIGAYWRANIALRHDETWRALGVPIRLTFLAVLTFLLLTITTPKRKWFLTSFISLFKEFWAAEVIKVQILIITSRMNRSLSTGASVLHRLLLSLMLTRGSFLLLWGRAATTMLLLSL